MIPKKCKRLAEVKTMTRPMQVRENEEPYGKK